MPKAKEENGKTIKGKASADVTQLTVKSNQKSDGYEALLDIEIALNEAKCSTLFGGDFARLAFGQMVEVEGDDGVETIHLAKSITAGKRFRLAKHVIKLGDYEIIAKPELKKISPIEKSDRVSTAIRLTVHVGEDDSLGAELVKVVGETVDVNFSPAQQDLPGV